MNRMLKWLGVATVFGIAMYVGIYVYGSRSEAYRYAQSWVRQSEPLTAAAGDIRDVRLSPWGGYRERFAGDGRNVRLVVTVTGSIQTVDVKLALQKANGTWGVTQFGMLEH